MSGIFNFGRGSDAVMHSEFMGFVIDEDSLLALRGWAERQGYPAATVQQGGSDIFSQMLESSAPPKIALVDIENQPDAPAILARLVSLCGGDCRLIAVGSANDVSLYRQIITAGAVDYLVKPLSPETLNQALAAALRAPSAANKKAAKEAKLIFFIGARGGVGTSTLALNTGWIMAHELKMPVALFDLDLQFGTSSLALDLDPSRGLRDIVSSPNRVDALMIASSITPESDNFSILGGEEAVDEVMVIDNGAITALLKEMKSNFEAIIIDMPRHMLAMHKRALTTAHEIVIVSDLSLSGIRDTLRIKTALGSIGYSGRITIVGSRVNDHGSGHVDRAVFEKGIQSSLDFMVAEDSASFANAANSGKPIATAAPRAAALKILREMTKKLVNAEEEVAAKKTSFFDKLLGSAAKTDIAAKSRGKS